MIFARGSRPFSLALEARVAFFCLNGLYKSSNLCKTSAFRISSFNSSVNLPCSSISRIISSFLSSRFLRYTNLSYKSLNTTSSSDPVCSFLYLAINGIVLPSSISFTVFSTWLSFKLNSLHNILIISDILFLPC